MSANIGIDYGLGQSNVDKLTGIRFGVISQHSVGQAWYDSAEADYGEPTCPECGNEAVEYNEDKHFDYEGHRHSCNDYACENCRKHFSSEDCFGDEPQGWNYDGDGYQLTDCLDSDIFILKSPFFTYAQFCSPCVPGACNLDNPLDISHGGLDVSVLPKCYCLGHDWFEDGKAPYRMFKVSDGSEA